MTHDQRPQATRNVGVCVKVQKVHFLRDSQNLLVYIQTIQLRTTHLKPRYHLGLNMNLVSLDPELSLNTIDTHRHNSNLFQPSLNFSPSYLVQACGRGCITAFNQTPSCLQLNAITFYQIKPVYLIPWDPA